MNDPRDVIIKPVVSEKSYALMETGVYTFVVHPSANRVEIREAVEDIFGVKVEKVNTYIHRDGKHAIIKLRKEFRAEDVAMRIGVY